MSIFHKSCLILLVSTLALLLGTTGASAQQQGGKPADTHQDLTDAKTWIQRLERPGRIPGLKTDAVITCLKLKPGEVVADIGAGTGAFSIPFAKAVAPSGRVLSVDIWPGLLDYINEKAKKNNVSNLQTILAKQDDPMLPKNQVDVAFFHDVFHNVNDRQAYLKILASDLKPNGRIAIVEAESNDPIEKKWDFPQDMITKDQLKGWMANVGFHKVGDFDIFEGANNPKGTGMPQRWFVVYARDSASAK